LLAGNLDVIADRPTGMYERRNDGRGCLRRADGGIVRRPGLRAEAGGEAMSRAIDDAERSDEKEGRR
jgi:hypothetical protein